jgi:hypothetical protein
VAPDAKRRRQRKATASRHEQREGTVRTPGSAPSPHLYAGVPKVSVNMRLLQTPLGAAGAQDRALEDLGIRTNRTELVEAMLHRELPGKPDDLADLGRAFRRARAG